MRTRLDVGLDAALLLAYTLAYSFGFTGPVLHEWIGLSIAVALIAHLTLHWDWVTRTVRQWARRGARQRLLWAVNLILAVSMTLCVMSGLYISTAALPELGLHTQATASSFIFWKRLHPLSANVTLGLVPLHVALDWKWIANIPRRMRRGRRPDGRHS